MLKQVNDFLNNWHGLGLLAAIAMTAFSLGLAASTYVSVPPRVARLEAKVDRIVIAICAGKPEYQKCFDTVGDP